MGKEELREFKKRTVNFMFIIMKYINNIYTKINQIYLYINYDFWI